ncbi:MAG: DUF4328 domain-containing protein [Pirellulales bacterium]
MPDPRLAPAAPYRPLTTRAGFASFCLAAVGVLHLYYFIEGGMTLWAVEARAGRAEIPGEVLWLYEATYSWVNLGIALAYLGSVIAFWMWFYRAHKNLRALGNEELEYKSRWAVFGFMVPILNLVRPAQVMRETWYGSDPGLLSESPTFLHSKARRGTPAAVGWWWGSFLIMNISSRAEMAAAEHAEKPDASPDVYQFYAWAVMISAVPTILAALLAVRLVWTITRRQSQRHDLLEGRAALPEPVQPQP